ncbi:MAG: tol-pal system-associated acyl-CoA thioesterase [Alphaproteobacteria bacterium]|nr:tol-pal system-associated acyl-CoA thioesterase [Alphaproteobacteria bacterium]
MNGLRVYYEDTDAAGIVYYANYLKFAERARTEFLRSLGGEHRAMKDALGVSFVVRSVSADYDRPARLDDELAVRTSLTKLGGASMTMTQNVECEARTLVKMSVRLACVGEGGKPVRMPAELRAALHSFQQAR